MNYTVSGKDITVDLDFEFSLGQTVDCGQAFRWQENDGVFSAVVGKNLIACSQQGNKLIFFDCDEDTFNNVVSPYFDFDTDYEAVKARLREDESLKKAIEYCGGIRILRQDPWEALCSFIISQNNNIPRIKGIIDRLCRLLGDEAEKDCYSFPSPEVIAEKTAEDLAPLRAGFRSKYIIDAAKKVSSGEVDFGVIENGADEAGREELMKICGVGPKVAECALLYGFGKHDAFPVDVWVKRILAEMYPQGLPECTKGVRGIAQQFLFHYRRNIEDA